MSKTVQERRKFQWKANVKSYTCSVSADNLDDPIAPNHQHFYVLLFFRISATAILSVNLCAFAIAMSSLLASCLLLWQYCDKNSRSQDTIWTVHFALAVSVVVKITLLFARNLTFELILPTGLFKWHNKSNLSMISSSTVLRMPVLWLVWCLP